MKDELVT
jgi:dynein heavy chain